MVDIILIAPGTQVQSVGAGGQQAQSATQPGVPAVPHLSPGALLAGVIAGKDTAGNYLLKTDQGTLTLHSATPLTYNSDVLIRVDNSNGSNAAARIISVNGESYAAYSAPIAEETDSLSPNLLAQAQGQQPKASNNTVAVATNTPTTSQPVSIPAVVVPPPAASSTATPTQPILPVPPDTPVTLILEPQPAASPLVAATTTPSPTQVTLSTPQEPAPNAQQQPVTQFTAPSTQPSSAPSPAPGQSTATVVPQQVSTGTAAAASVQTELPGTVARLLSGQSPVPQLQQAPSSLFDATPTTTQAPASPQTLQTSQYAVYGKSTSGLASQIPLPQQAPQLLDATITATTEKGHVLLQTPQGQLAVKPDAEEPGSAQLTVGTPLTLSIPAAALALATTTPVSVSTQDTLTTTLLHILGQMQAKSPDVAADIQSRLPSLDNNFLASSLQFMASLMQGNARKILGEGNLKTIRDAGAGPLIEKFFSQAETAQNILVQSTTQQNNQSPANWQGLVLPFVYEGMLQEAKLYVKREPPKKEKDQKKSGDTRFVVEITLSELGEMQLDGLVLPRTASTVFDLMVRTHTAFNPEDKTNLTQIFNDTSQLTGFKGSISFSHGREFPVKPLTEMQNFNGNDFVA